MCSKFISINSEQLNEIAGGSSINWGQAAGACGESAVIGLYFGNPILGCANGFAGSLLL